MLGVQKGHPTHGGSRDKLHSPSSKQNTPIVKITSPHVGRFVKVASPKSDRKTNNKHLLAQQKHRVGRSLEDLARVNLMKKRYSIV